MKRMNRVDMMAEITRVRIEKGVTAEECLTRLSHTTFSRDLYNLLAWLRRIERAPRMPQETKTAESSTKTLPKARKRGTRQPVKPSAATEGE